MSPPSSQYRNEGQAIIMKHRDLQTSVLESGSRPQADKQTDRQTDRQTELSSGYRLHVARICEGDLRASVCLCLPAYQLANPLCFFPLSAFLAGFAKLGSHLRKLDGGKGFNLFDDASPESTTPEGTEKSHHRPTEQLPILEPQNPWISGFYVVQKHRSDF